MVTVMMGKIQIIPAMPFGKPRRCRDKRRAIDIAAKVMLFAGITNRIIR
jgi:hypothetical protein